MSQMPLWGKCGFFCMCGITCDLSSYSPKGSRSVCSVQRMIRRTWLLLLCLMAKRTLYGFTISGHASTPNLANPCRLWVTHAWILMLAVHELVIYMLYFTYTIVVRNHVKCQIMSLLRLLAKNHESTSTVIAIGLVVYGKALLRIYCFRVKPPTLFRPASQIWINTVLRVNWGTNLKASRCHLLWWLKATSVIDIKSSASRFFF